MIADYLADVERYAVFPRVRPGEVRGLLGTGPPEQAEPLDTILDDYRRLIVPNVTHWNHPGFLAYFATTGSVPGILAEALAASLNSQAMLWRTGPAATELEGVVCDWLRQLVALPDGFTGHINDTASTSSLVALAGARHRAVPEARLEGVAAAPPLAVYASEHAHSSIEKACLTLGLGLGAVRKVAADGACAMRAETLARMIEADRREGRRPIAVVATVGTTSSAAVDPVDAVARIAAAEDLWLHVDAAYAGSAAVCPEFRDRFTGWEHADSIVINPHKWLFTPMDCSVLLLKDPETVKGAFSLTPEYLRTPESGVTNLSELGFQLGRRFRSLKLWFVMRAYGAEGLRARIRDHCAIAAEFADWVRNEPGFELCAPPSFSVVCFRAVVPGGPERQDAFNARLLDEVNAAGPVFLSHTRLAGRLVLRVAVGNIRTTREHLASAWSLIRRKSRELPQ